jgi:hypothetical protein
MQLMDNGLIVGWNYGYCSTCGGFYLNLSDDSTINSDTYYVLNYSDALTPTILQYSKQYNKNHNPIKVLVSWDPIPSGRANWIRVTDIRSR